MRRAPPLILGAGPAGSAAAIALARDGLRPVLLDRDSEVRDQLCGGFLSWRTVEQLHALDVSPARLGGRRIERLALFAGHSESTLELPAPAFGLSRRALDTALRQRAVELGAILEVDTARSVEGTTVIGRQREWHSESLFLATGKHDVRGPSRPRAARDPALGLRIRLPASPKREALLAGRIELHLFAGGYAGIVLQEDGSANVCLAMRKSALAANGGDPSRLLDSLAASHPGFADRLASDWTGQPVETVGAVPYGWIARSTGTGLFRLGDQAAVIPSLAGEGIAIALASGAMAARHWLERGPAGAVPYQLELAARAVAPVRTARLAWRIAEHPLAATLGLALARQVPPVLAWLMNASRVTPDAPLAQARAAP